MNKAIHFENHFVKRKVGSERAIAEDLLDKPIVHILIRRPWGSLLSFEVNEILVDCVCEFYNDMDIVSGETFKTYVRGKWIIANPSELTELLDIPIPYEFDYPLQHDS